MLAMPIISITKSCHPWRVQILVLVSIFFKSKYLDMKAKILSRYNNLTTNSLALTIIERILVNIMQLYKSGRSITTLTTYWKKCQISTFTFRPYGPTNNMCKSKATFWINMVLFQSLICFKFNFFYLQSVWFLGITPAARLRMAAVSSLWLRDTYWPRCSRPRAHYGLRWRTTTHWDLIAKFRQKLD